MSNRIAVAAMMAATLAASACASSADDLAGSEWRPVAIGDAAVPEDVEIFVRFEADGALKGNGGCNNFFGSYQTSESSFEVGPLGATRMACPEPIMDMEDAFMGALQAGKSFKRERIKLELFDEHGAAVMTLAQRDAD